jgi:hypothetical protein
MVEGEMLARQILSPTAVPRLVLNRDMQRPLRNGGAGRSFIDLETRHSRGLFWEAGLTERGPVGAPSSRAARLSWTESAAQRMVKTVEQPFVYVVFILARRPDGNQR